METDQNSLWVKACTFERANGSVALLKAFGSATNHLLVNKGLVTASELSEAVSAEIDSLNAEYKESVSKSQQKTDMLAAEGAKLTDEETQRIQAALNRYEKILRNCDSFASLRGAMLDESVRVAEEFRLDIPRL